MVCTDGLLLGSRPHPRWTAAPIPAPGPARSSAGEAAPGDLATGVAYRLHMAGCRVVMSELPDPLCVRRLVSFAEAVHLGCHSVEDLCAVPAGDVDPTGAAERCRTISDKALAVGGGVLEALLHLGALSIAGISNTDR